MWPVGDWEGTDYGLAVVSAVTGLALPALPALRALAAGIGRPVQSLTAVDLAAVLSAVGVACRVAVPEVNPRQWVPWWHVAWSPGASTLAVVRHPRGPHWVAERDDLVADGLGRLTPGADYWGRQADACAELVRLGGVDTGRGHVPSLPAARLVRRFVDGSVVVRGQFERPAAVPAQCGEVRADADPARLVFPPCIDCAGPVTFNAEWLPMCRRCRSLFDWERGNGCTRP